MSHRYVWRRAGEFFFMGPGGLGVSLAGFAGMIATLDRRPEAHSPVAAWRIRNIVTSGLILTVAGFGIVAVHTATGESVDTTVRVVNLVLALVKAIQIPREGRRGPELPSEVNRRIAVGSSLLVVLLLILNVWLGRVGFLQILFVVLLIDPISIFVRTVMDVASSNRRREELKKKKAQPLPEHELVPLTPRILDSSYPTTR